jgi:hypothetical protein
MLLQLCSGLISKIFCMLLIGLLYTINNFLEYLTDHLDQTFYIAIFIFIILIKHWVQ